MATRRLLLAASALSTLAFGCKSKPEDPPPGNPKGTFYDAALVAPPPQDAEPAVDAATPDAAGPPPRDAGSPPRDASGPRDATVQPRDPEVRPLPGNPKGSRYDAGVDVLGPRPQTPPRDR